MFIEVKCIITKKKKNEDLLFNGANTIGKVIGPSKELMIAIDNILLPYSLTADSLGWCKTGEVDFLLGAYNNRFLVRDDPM